MKVNTPNLLAQAGFAVMTLLGVGDNVAQGQDPVYISRLSERDHVNRVIHQHGRYVKNSTLLSDKISPHYFTYPNQFAVKLDSRIANSNDSKIIYDKLFIDIPAPSGWVNVGDPQFRYHRSWADARYADDPDKSWTELVNRLAFHYPPELIRDRKKLAETIFQDVKPFIDRDVNWRLFPKLLAKLIRNDISAEQVGTLNNFRKIYNLKIPIEESIVNLLINQVSPEALDKEFGDVSLAISRANENRLHELCENYCKAKGLEYSRDKINSFIKEKLGFTTTPVAINGHQYKSEEMSYSRVSGEAIFRTLINLAELERIKSLKDVALRQKLLEEFFAKSAVFAITRNNVDSQRVFEGGSGLKGLAQADSVEKIKLLLFEVNLEKERSPQNQILDFLVELTTRKNENVGKVRNLNIAFHGNSNSISLGLPYKNSNRTLNNEGCLAYDDIDFLKKLASVIDQKYGVINAQSCEIAGIYGVGESGFPHNNIAEIIAGVTGISVNAPAYPTPNADNDVVWNGEGYSVISSHGLGAFLLSSSNQKSQNDSTTGRQPIRSLLMSLLGR